MRLSDSDVAKYPKFAQYVRFRMPELLSVASVVSSVKKYGGLSREEFAHALRWKNDPLIVITPLDAGQCSGSGAANGCFRASNSHQIEIDTGRVEDFEKDPYGKGIDFNSGKKAVFIVGTILLHELCHWGNYKNGINYTAGEEGKDFETAAYGRDIGWDR